ncbi:sulfite exporter TauE/SafE family protein [Patescibacteria group bacterium]|nr:sulfite exporter TauE/SafE family protein [Patescibacteria group bacterium]MBU1755249.1 sulfite exporter TauE/SafE family protein [Patescibacteria group bacterium]
MDFLIIGLVAFGASALTFFSGFGLGTLLLPAFALFFTTPIALMATGIVHLLNNLFKGTLVWKLVDWPTVLRFGLPAIPSAILGAFLLTYLDARIASIVIGIILILFAILEFQSWFQRLTFPRKYVSFGGILTGFMGGLSGQQGAIRSMFLLKSDFDAKHYIATGVFIAVLIDLARLPTYVLGLRGASAEVSQHELLLIGFGTLCAFTGAWLGARYAKKTTIGLVRYVVAGLMLVIGTLLVFGIIGT